jgi:hypothetical protein
MPGSLHLDGKLGGTGRPKAVAAGQLIHMPDQTSTWRFLVVIWLVQMHKPMAETFSSAHNSGAASAGAANAGAASGAASSGAASAGPASKQNPNPNPAVACASAPPVCEPKPNPAVACASAPPVCEPKPNPNLAVACASAPPVCEPKPNTNPAVACASAPPVSEPEAEPEQNLLSGDVTPPEDQRSPSADRGLPQRTSGTSYEPVCANPNPAVACVSAPPISEPEADFLRRWRGLPRRRPV